MAEGEARCHGDDPEAQQEVLDLLEFFSASLDSGVVLLPHWNVMEQLSCCYCCACLGVQKEGKFTFTNINNSTNTL